ncbi:tetratricopeptide repeat protein [Portibacter lacus]|uniref:Tetratricopeptide repeat protein n=1 Tax=Portibacter lacus TaxID=1099794 RepID=A0AA37SP38_9BACT|nr:tetratricopeptide repeat protein [Portibacter lacus]GLR18308.1 hypothetical protein GCM10007940_29240 [Portibacter lacus]
MYRFLILFSVIFLIQCSPDQKGKSNFSALEEKAKAEPTPENVGLLLKAYNTHLKDNQDDLEVYEKAYFLAKENQSPAASSYLTNLISKSDPGSKKSSDWLYELAGSLEKQNKQEAALVIYGNLIKRFPAYPKLNEIKEKLGDNTPASIIERLTQSRLENPDQFGINRNEAFKYVDACEAYALSAPEDPKSPEYLFNAAEIAKLLKTYNKALSLYDRLIEGYPDYKKTPSALFIKAFTLENELGNEEEARKAYTLFLEKYPEDNFADDAKFSLENLGKTPDEVLKAIEAKSNQ